MSLPKITGYSLETVYIDRVVASACFIHNIAIFTKVWYDNHKSRELSASSALKYGSLLYYVTLATIASFCLYMLAQLLVVFDWTFDSLHFSCPNVILIGPCSTISPS